MAQRISETALASHKQSLKFLNTLCFGLKNKVMLLSRQSLQVLRAVIVLDAVKMMNYPAFRQWLTVSFFPYKNVLKDIAVGGAGMLWLPNKNIPITVFSFTAFPLRMIYTCAKLTSTMLTRLRSFRAGLTANNTRVFVLPSKSPIPFFRAHNVNIA